MLLIMIFARCCWKNNLLAARPNLSSNNLRVTFVSTNLFPERECMGLQAKLHYRKVVEDGQTFRGKVLLLPAGN